MRWLIQHVVGDLQLLSAAPRLRGGRVCGAAPAGPSSCPGCRALGGGAHGLSPVLWPGCTFVTAAQARSGTGAFPAPLAATP